MTEKTNVPEIRFVGFTDPWEQRKFSDLTDRVSIQSSDPDLPQVEYEDIISGMGMLNKDLRDKEGGKTGIKFYAGDVLYGKLRPYLMNWLYPQFNGVAVGDFWVLRATECDSSFLYRLVQTDSFQRLANVSSGSKMPRADWNLISQSFFAVPADHAEQKAIAKSLAELDNLITLHQRKHDKLAQLKKSMLDKMFPKPGERFPEIRFVGFTDPWEQRNWSDSVRISTDMVDPKSGLYDDLPHIGPGNIESFTGRLYDNVHTVKEDAIISGKFHFFPGDVIYGKINPQLGKYAFAQMEGLASADAYVLNGYNGIDQEYLFSLLQTEQFFRYTVSVSMRSGMPKINRDELDAFSFLAPYEEEQRKIGYFLRAFDRLITLHQRKLELLRNTKKSLLDRMFV